MTFMSDVLKRCPLCGSKGALEEVDSGGWTPFCTANEMEEECLLGNTLLVFPRKVEAINKWNKRVVILENEPAKLDPSLY